MWTCNTTVKATLFGVVSPGGYHLHRLLVWRRSTRFVSMYEGDDERRSRQPHVITEQRGGRPGLVRSALLKYIHAIHSYITVNRNVLRGGGWGGLPEGGRRQRPLEKP